MLTEKAADSFLFVRHEVFKTTAQHFHHVSPRITHIRSLVFRAHLDCLSDLFPTVVQHPLHRAIYIRRRNSNVEKSAPSIFEVWGWLKWRVNELKHFESDAVAGAQPRDLDFVQL